MLDDWFPYVVFEIPWKGFHELPKHPAYKWEYWDGQAHLTARPKFAHGLLSFDAWPGAPEVFGRREEGFRFRPLANEDWERFPSLLAAAFHRVPPFSQLEERATEAAKDCLERTRAGEDGPLVTTACRVAEAEGRVVGGLLVSLMSGGDPEEVDTWWRDRKPGADAVEKRSGRPHLTWAFVSPWFARHGIGSALLGEAITALSELGYKEIASSFLIGNDSSMLWHWRNGFRLLPGLDGPRSIRRSVRRLTTDRAD